MDVQLKAWNCEVIWARSEGQYDDTFQRSWMVHNTPGPHCLGGVSPTLRLVDAFLMKNGKPIDVAGSGYVEKDLRLTVEIIGIPTDMTLLPKKVVKVS